MAKKKKAMKQKKKTVRKVFAKPKKKAPVAVSKKPAPKPQPAPSKPAPQPVEKPEAEAEEPKQKHEGLQALRGMKDILPKEQQYWYALLDHAQRLAQFYDFGWIQTPLLEDARLYVRSIGRGTDIVEKEMYVFEDRDMDRVAIRPEGTAGVVRAYIQHGMLNLPQPVKLWYWGSMFRHERPQKGRYREHHQIGFELFGDTSSSADAHLIAVAYSLLSDLGINVEVRINSIGMPEDRARYIMELTGYYRAKRSYLCEDCKKRLTKNPLRLLDCKEEGCKPLRDEAPQIVDWLSEPSKKFFMELLEDLDELQIPYALDPFLVRGLDYYTHTVFEFYAKEREKDGEDEKDSAEGGEEHDGNKEAVPERAQSALGGGGRYDLLVEHMGGRPTPAVGFGLGMERIVTELKKRPDDFEPKPPTVFLAHLGQGARRKALALLQQLHAEGMRVGFNLSKTSLKAQLDIADKYKVRYTLILGQKEMMDSTIIIRDMESGAQEIIDIAKVVPYVKKML
ncbi:MAG: histidine--tRNA ligase [Patescibacteria group bacterium]